jgi:hypothetical protein
VQIIVSEKEEMEEDNSINEDDVDGRLAQRNDLRSRLLQQQEQHKKAQEKIIGQQKINDIDTENNIKTFQSSFSDKMQGVERFWGAYKKVCWKMVANMGSVSSWSVDQFPDKFYK